MKGCLAALGILAAVICGVVALAALLNYFLSDREPPWLVITSSISPDNTFVAENAMANGEEGSGRISVRRLNGADVYEALFNEAQPAFFLRWIDDSHLLVLSDSRSRITPVTSSKKDGSLEVSYSTYVRLGAADASIAAKTHTAIALAPADVTATFGENAHSLPPLKQCTLTLSANDGKIYSDIGMTIIAGVFPCGPPSLRGKLCGAVESHFRVGQKVDHAGPDILTSATVSEIPSYNDLPDGVGYRAIKGTFLQGSAALLIEALKKPSFDIDYNLEFNEQNIRYTVPTSAISASLSEFLKCVDSVVF